VFVASVVNAVVEGHGLTVRANKKVPQSLRYQFGKSVRYQFGSQHTTLFAAGGVGETSSAGVGGQSEP